MYQKNSINSNLPEVLLQRLHEFEAISPLQPYATEMKLTVLVILPQSAPRTILLASLSYILQIRPTQ